MSSVLDEADERVESVELMPAVGGWLAIAELRWGVRIGVLGQSKDEALILLKDAVEAWDRLREV